EPSKAPGDPSLAAAEPARCRSGPTLRSPQSASRAQASGRAMKWGGLLRGNSSSAIGGTTFRVKPLTAILVALLLSACHAQQSPDDAFRAFTLAVLSHQTDSAWGLISKDSQEAMTQAVQTAAARPPKGQIPAAPTKFFSGKDT